MLTFETIGGSTNLRAKRKQIAARRHLPKCLSNLVSKCLSNLVSESLYHIIIFLKKHQLILVLEKKGSKLSVNYIKAYLKKKKDDSVAERETINAMPKIFY